MSDLERSAIPVAIGRDAHQLLAYGGRPVWPAPTPNELSAIEQAAALGGNRVDVIDAAPAGEPDGTELVVGVGRPTAAIARLYAHLTGRRVAHAADLASAARQDPAVIVAMESDLAVEALDQLAERASAGQVIGMIAGHDTPSLLTQALIRAAARPGTSRTPSRLALFPTRERSEKADDGDGVLDMATSSADLRAALGRGAGVLTVMAHSDGVDANLGSAVLCPMDRTPEAADPERVPHCRQLGRCHRSGGMAIEQWLADPRRLAPEIIAARVLMFATCWGILPPIAFDDSAWSLGRRLLANPRIGALVTSWEVHAFHPEDLLGFARDLSGGLDLGASVARLLATEYSRQTGLRLCLLGDPRLQLAPTPVPPPPPASARRDDGDAGIALSSSALDARSTGELAFLRLYVLAIAPDIERAAGDAALEAIGRYELACARGHAERDRDPVVDGWRDRVLDAVVARGPIAVHNWTSLSRGPRTRSTVTRCPHCQQRVLAREYPLRIPEAGPRIVMTCTRCGVIADGPGPRSIAIRVHRGAVHLTSDVPRNHWSARLVTYAKGERGAKLSVPWPAAGDGWPARSLPVPDGIGHGAHDVAVFLLHGVSWYIARVPVRSP